MGFPVGYTEVFMPRVFFHFLSLMGFMRTLVTVILTSLGLSDFLESDLSSSVQSWPSDPIRCSTSRSASLIRELLPVVKFEEVREAGDHLVEGCAVCLYEFEEGEEIRWLRNCKHVFHRSCIDRWMDQDKDTCPLCRNPFVPAEMREEFEKRLWDGLLVGDGDYDDFLLNCELVSVPLL